MFINDIFKKKQLNEGGFDIPEIPRAPQPKPAPTKDKTVDEAGPFSYGAKKPKKGSVADLAAKKRQEQEKGKQPIEPKDQRVGVARVTKDLAEGRGNIEALRTELMGEYLNIYYNALDGHNMTDQIINLQDVYGRVKRSRDPVLQQTYNLLMDHAEESIDVQASAALKAIRILGDEPNYTPPPRPPMSPEDSARADAFVNQFLAALVSHGIKTHPDWQKNNDKGVAEGFDDLDRFMKDKYGPQSRGGSGIKTGTYGSPRRKRGRPTGAESLSGGSDIPHAIDFDRPHSERSAGRKLPRFSDDYDAIKRSEVDEGSAQDKLYKRHQELRKKSGLPDPNYYKELKASYDLPDQERYAKQKEIKQKYKVTNEELPAPDVGQKVDQALKDLDSNTNDLDQLSNKIRTTVPKTRVDTTKWTDEQRFLQDKKVGKFLGSNFDEWKQQRNQTTQSAMPTNEDRERYIEELGRAGYEIITEKKMTCPECGGAAYEDRILAEKQDACYHKVKSRYKVWPSAYASGALVRCRKKGAKNWGNKSK